MVVIVDAVRSLLAVFLAFWVGIFCLWAVLENNLALIQDCLGTNMLMYYSRGLLIVITVVLLLIWALDGLLRVVGVARMHAAAPLLGHQGLPNATALISLMIQLLVSFVTLQLMKVRGRSHICQML